MGLPQICPPQTMPEMYYDAYCASAQMRLSTRDHARTWWSLGIPAEVAGAWARHGFTPAQGWDFMNQDFTPQTAPNGDPR